MDFDDACRVLADFGLNELLDPASWHWIIEDGWFKYHLHHPEYADMLHIKEVLRANPDEKKILLGEALSVISSKWKDSKNKELQKASVAISLLKQEPDSHYTKELCMEKKAKWQSDPRNKMKIAEIVIFFSFDRGIEDATRRLHEALAHPGQDSFIIDASGRRLSNGEIADRMTKGEKGKRLSKEEIKRWNDTLWPLDPSAGIDEVLEAKRRSGGDLRSYIRPVLICKHFMYLLAEISRHHYGHEVYIVSTSAGSKLFKNADGGDLTNHVVVYDKTDGVYRDPSAYVWLNSEKHNIENLSYKETGVILR